jgi:alcohol dehydrogenase (cytochrome c)
MKNPNSAASRLISVGKHVCKAVAGAVFLSACVAGGAVVAEEKTIADGVFTQAQVDAGKQVYDMSCKGCHNARFYRDTLRNWDGQPVMFLWETILGTMPGDNPGSLFEEEYTDVLAYIFSEQDFPTGDTALDPNNGMDQITIVAP